MHGGTRVGDIEISSVCEGFAPLVLEDEFPGTEIDWAAFADRDDGEDYTARHAMEELERRGILSLRADDHDVASGVHVTWTPGHTPGHRSVLVRSGGETLLLTGDVLHTPTQVRLPGAPSSLDEDPEAAAATRERLIKDARERGWAVAVTHFAQPFGTVEDDGWRSA
jgi:glyoxylase-like metal-dependent hydrolase (beta-lactamase superfamily II)